MSRVRWASKIATSSSNTEGMSLLSVLSSSSNRLKQGQDIVIDDIRNLSYTDIGDIHTLNETVQFPKSASDFWADKAGEAAIDWVGPFSFNPISWRNGYTNNTLTNDLTLQKKRIFESTGANLKKQIDSVNQRTNYDPRGAVTSANSQDNVFNSTYPYSGPTYQRATIPVIPGQTLYFAGVGGAGGSMPLNQQRRGHGGNGAWAVGRITVPEDVYTLSLVYGGGGETVTKDNGQGPNIARGGYPGGGDSGFPGMTASTGSAANGYGYYACAGGGYTAIWSGVGELNANNALVVIGGGGGAGAYPATDGNSVDEYAPPSGGNVRAPVTTYFRPEDGVFIGFVGDGKDAYDSSSVVFQAGGDEAGRGGSATGGLGVNRNVTFTYNNATSGSFLQGGHGEGSNFDSGGGGGGGFFGGGGGMGGGGLSSTQGGGGSSFYNSNYVYIEYSTDTKEEGLLVSTSYDLGNITTGTSPMAALINQIAHASSNNPQFFITSDWIASGGAEPASVYKLENFGETENRNIMARAGMSGQATSIGGGSDGYLAVWDGTAIGAVIPSYVSLTASSRTANNTVLESSSNLNETRIDIELETRNVPIGTTIPITFTGITDGDVSGNLPTEITVNNTYGGSLLLTVSPDNVTEGTETGTVQLNSVDSEGNSTGSLSATLPQIIDNSLEIVGEQVYNTPGIYTFTVPTGVSEVHIFAVGAGGGGQLSRGSSTGTERSASGGGGAGSAWASYVPVTPGQTFSVGVPAGGAGGTVATQTYASNNGTSGGSASISGITGFSLFAQGGGGGASSGGAGGVGSVSTSGLPAGNRTIFGVGRGGTGTSRSSGWDGGGGGGAGGYGPSGSPVVQARGGNGGIGSGSDGTYGSGGGGASSEYQNQGGFDRFGGNGGGVGTNGQGSNGAGASQPTDPLVQQASSGGFGSGGNFGYGGGGDQRAYFGATATASSGGNGAVRIRWGESNAYP